jgi:integrase
VVWYDGDLVFPTVIGTPMDARNLLWRSFCPLLDRADVPRIRFHDLRHTAVTLLLSQGVNAKVVSEMPGHSTIGMTLDIPTRTSCLVCSSKQPRPWKPCSGRKSTCVAVKTAVTSGYLRENTRLAFL